MDLVFRFGQSLKIRPDDFEESAKCKGERDDSDDAGDQEERRGWRWGRYHETHRVSKQTRVACVAIKDACAWDSKVAEAVLSLVRPCLLCPLPFSPVFSKHVPSSTKLKRPETLSNLPRPSGGADSTLHRMLEANPSIGDRGGAKHPSLRAVAFLLDTFLVKCFARLTSLPRLI